MGLCFKSMEKFPIASYSGIFLDLNYEIIEVERVLEVPCYSLSFIRDKIAGSHSLLSSYLCTRCSADDRKRNRGIQRMM